MTAVRPLICALAATLALASPSAFAAADCGPLLPIVQATYAGLSPLPSPADHPENDRYRVSDNRVLDIARDGPDSYNAHVVTCKPWPARDDLLLVVVPLLDPSVDSDVEHKADLDVLVVDAATSERRQFYRLADAASDDAMMLRDITIDTARYNVSQNNRAFGVRVTRENNSRANPASETTLYLFDRPRGDTGPLRLVMSDLVVNAEYGEWDTNCAGEFHSMSVTLSMAPTATRGMQDIVLRSESETNVNKPKGQDCMTRTQKHRTETETLQFDGKQYPVPVQLHRLAG
ncbi:hypothetical protein IMZ29_09780 [Achromobacter sp. GG226]|uniref:hypothetical protein n=1 Tax=Verticiella alkaliphila TaxID=2779529 RepID=UPI001C0C5EE0|nr:hypothetical protein [Verticiella sp. GG226]MBU4610808.1 hypothetical protein [Verticiella sp. GG226]